MLEGHASAILMLADGTIFKGYALGAIGTTTGEICYNTGMTGYQEIFTDPSYFGQIMTMTNAHIGNYGVHDKEQESARLKISGLFCRNFTDESYSRKLSSGSLHNYLAKQQLVGIKGVDTRALVKHVRDKGAMNAIVSSEHFDQDWLQDKLAAVPPMDGLELSSKVTTNAPYTVGSNDAAFKVAALDLGMKQTITEQLVARDCQVKVFPPLKTWKLGSRMAILFPMALATLLPSITPFRPFKRCSNSKNHFSGYAWVTNCLRLPKVLTPIRCITDTGVSTIP